MILLVSSVVKPMRLLCRSRRCVLLVLFWFPLIGGTACLWNGPDVFNSPIRNVLLISIDTCRPDYLSCYGLEYQTTPHIDAVAATGTLFENVVSPTPMTLPAHSTMLTGTIPPYHGVHDNLSYRLGDTHVSLAELLQSRGWDTGAVIGAYVLDSQFGLDQGFDTYEDQFDDVVNFEGQGTVADRRGDEVSRKALEWLSDHQENPFFLFLHYYDPHHRYDPPEPFRSRFSNRPQSLYMGEISYVDHCVGKVLERLKKLGLDESTLIIITSDHGEMLGEHGELSHSYFIYQEAIRVPLVIRLPGQKRPQRIGSMVGLVDLMPTICDLLDIETPGAVRGESLAPWLREGRGGEENRLFYCESLTPTKYGANHLLGLVADEWKYIETTQPELYDLEKDPGETTNLLSRQPERARQLREQLRSIFQEQLRQRDADSYVVAGVRGQQSLASLGYVSGTVNEDFDLETDTEKEDPKDLIGFHDINVGMHDRIYQKQYDLVRVLAERMIETKPDFPDSYMYLARIATEQGQLTDALLHWEKVLHLNPGHENARLNVGNIFKELGNFKAAERHYEQILKRNAFSIDGHNQLATILQQQGKLKRAIEYYNKALEIDPNNVSVMNNLGCALKSVGRLDAAREYFEQAIFLKPNHVNAQANLAGVHWKKGNLDEAIRRYRRILIVDSNHMETQLSLANALMEKNKPAEATHHYAAALRLRPDFPETHFGMGRARMATGKWDKARENFQQALKKRPKWPSALSCLAWTFARHPGVKERDSEKAIHYAEQAATLTQQKNPEILRTLAAAYASAGSFQQAAITAELALNQLEQQSLPVLGNLIRSDLESYRRP